MQKIWAEANIWFKWIRDSSPYFVFIDRAGLMPTEKVNKYILLETH